jgi:hypothetical protein
MAWHLSRRGFRRRTTIVSYWPIRHADQRSSYQRMANEIICLMISRTLLIARKEIMDKWLKCPQVS